MGRHSLASPSRRRFPTVAAAVIAPAAVLFAVGDDAHWYPAKEAAKPVVEPVAAADTCCMEVVAASAALPAVAPAAVDATPARADRASRWRVIDIPQLLPVGVAPERGLQVKTILAARSVSAAFPEIHSIGGVRPDALRWHPNGLAIDVMIPNAGSADGIALGNKIVAYALKNADRFDLQDAIWRDTYYTPDGGAKPGGYGHYDHVHLTTRGGGYPSGGELYLR